jgi:uncharacterized delta-60 repeat protein
MFIPYLAFGCDSVDFNIERVSGYVRNLCDTCSDPSMFRLTGKIDCDCPPLGWDPYTPNLDNPNQSIPVRYTSPAGDSTVLTGTITGATYGGNGYVTYDCVNTFEVGQIITITLPDDEWLASTHFVITDVTPTTFSGYVPCTVCDSTDPVVTTEPGSTFNFFDPSTLSSYVAGTFQGIDGTPSPGVGNVSLSGNVNTTFSANAGTGFDGQVLDSVVQPDGKIVYGGYFGSYNGTPVGYIARVNTDGTLDTTFTTNTGTGFDDYVSSIALQSDGKIVCVGSMSMLNGSYVPSYIARLNADGTEDTAFTATIDYGFDNYTDCVALDNDENILIGTSSGYLEFDDGTIHRVNGLTKLSPTGSFIGSYPTNFVTHDGFDGTVYSIKVQPDGKIVVGGDFGNVNNYPYSYIVRFNADGTIDTAFSTNANAVIDSTVYSTMLDSYGRVYVGGDFTGYLKRLNADGTVDPAFAPVVDNVVNDIGGFTAYAVLVGGYFTSVNSTTANRIALIHVTNGTLVEPFTTNIGTGIEITECCGIDTIASAGYVPATGLATLHDEAAAPWYDADVAASGRFLGYIIEEFTGLESPAKRDIVPKMSGSGGGVFGPSRNNPRQFQISALMFACDQEAMDYGFRYLKDALGYWACSKCETCDMEFATACQPLDAFPNGYYQPPAQTDVLRNRWTVYGVGLVEGPTYAEAPIPRVACNIRRVQFILAAEDPWLYECAHDEGTFDLGLTGSSSEDINSVYSNSTVTATVTAVSASGTAVTYTSINTFRTGDLVTVTGLTPTTYNLTNAVVLWATASAFAIASDVTGVATIPPNGTATLVARSFEHVQPIVSSTNIGEIALNITIDNPSAYATYSVSVSLYPDSLGYKYWEWQGITGTAGYATSTTTASTVPGTVSLTTQAGLGWAVGARLRAVSESDITAYIEGTVVSYSSTTLVIEADTVGQYGASVSDWAIGKPTPTNWETPDPCARVVVSTIPAGYSFSINSASETYTLMSDTGEMYDGTPYVKVEPGTIPEFLTARCGTYALGVAGSYTDLGPGTTYTVETQHREL